MQKLTMEQAVVVSIYTGYLVCPFEKVHAAIEERLGRPVWTHEMANSKLMDDVRKMFMDEFVSMAPSKDQPPVQSDQSPDTDRHEKDESRAGIPPFELRGPTNH